MLIELEAIHSSCAAGPPADTFWRSVVQGAVPHETLPLEHPPTLYYDAPCEGWDRKLTPRLTGGQASMQQVEAAASVAAAPALTAA